MDVEVSKEDRLRTAAEWNETGDKAVVTKEQLLDLYHRRTALSTYMSQLLPDQQLPDDSPLVGYRRDSKIIITLQFVSALDKIVHVSRLPLIGSGCPAEIRSSF